MIERVVLHQSRFRVPGLTPDSRGVALGPVGVVLLPSAERLVAFLRACGEEGALDELLDGLRILQVISPLRTREMVVELQSGSSHRMDRIAAIARLMGAMVFTGAGRHFVKYRDVQAPFGYDATEVLPEPGDLSLYHDRFSQPYRIDRTIGVRDLLLRLAPVPVPRSKHDSPRALFAMVHLGLGESVVGYLARWAVQARVARIEWLRGGTSDQVDRALLLQMNGPAPRFVQLLRSLPGVRLFVPDGERAVVEYGYRHPIPLSACTPLFASEELVLFRAGGEGAIPLPSRPPFVDVATVTHVAGGTVEPARSTQGTTEAPSFSLELRVVPSSAPPRRVSALLIPVAEQALLGRVLSVLPSSALSQLTAAFTADAIYLHGAEGASNVPLGLLFEELGSGVFVPLGHTLSPPVPPDVLRQLTHMDSRTRLFVTGGRVPITAIPESAFVPATRLLLSDVPVFEDSTIAPPLDAERLLPDLWPEAPGALATLFAPGARGSMPESRVVPELPSPGTKPDDGGAPNG